MADTKRRIAQLVADRSPPGDGVADELLSSLARTVDELTIAEGQLRAQAREVERHRELLSDEQARYRTLFEHAPVPCVITDAHGVIRNANRAAAHFLGHRRDHLRGKPVDVFVHEVSRRQCRVMLRLLERAKRGTRTVTLNLAARRDRVARVLAVVSSAPDSAGDFVELRWLLIDKTRRPMHDYGHRHPSADGSRALASTRTRQLEAERQLKDQLLATVSHEFRTALAAIGGYADLLEIGARGPLAGPQLADVRRIKSASRHLSGVVNDLLSYSKIAAGNIALDLEDTSLYEAVGGMLDLVEPHAAEREIAVSIGRFDPKITVRADVERVRQIVLNLVTNAIKFTPRGGHVRIEADLDDRFGRLVIQDSGPGIPPEDMEAVFRPFVRLSKGTPGTGLGLGISRDLARAMGGDLYVDATAETGGRLVLRLLLAANPPRAAAPGPV